MLRRWVFSSLKRREGKLLSENDCIISVPSGFGVLLSADLLQNKMPETNYCSIKENTVLVCCSFLSCIICTNAIFWLLWGTVFAESGTLFWKSNIPLPLNTGEEGWLVFFKKAFVRTEQL